MSASLTPEGLVSPIVQGKLGFDGVNLAVTIEKSIDKNSRQMLDGRFDLCEMSLATFVKARTEGMPIIGLPVFTGRRFLQPLVLCSRAAQISSMSELAGKRIGLPQFWMTSSVWHRGILQELYGISQERVNWTTTAAERLKINWPKKVTVQQMAVAGGPTELLISGEVDCVMMPKIGQTPPDWIVPVDDVEQSQIDYYSASGVFPIMHLIVASEQLLSKHPTLAPRIMEGLRHAKSLASLEKPIPSLSAERSLILFGDDPWPIGIEPNRRSIETFLGYALDQELIARPVAAEELFVAGLSV
jgi:4,5-dihydroxyphthalate decarboxylase